jgi:CP family cyanate transporter-like MFS transporter
VLVDMTGVGPRRGGALLSLFGAMGLPWSILVPIAVTRWNRVAVYGVALVAVSVGFSAWSSRRPPRQCSG